MKKHTESPTAPAHKCAQSVELMLRLTADEAEQIGELSEEEHALLKSVILGKRRKSEKSVGESGNRTQPNESDPPAVHKAAAPPRRGRLSNTDVTPGESAGSEIPQWAIESSAVLSQSFHEYKRQHPSATKEQLMLYLIRIAWEHASAISPTPLADLLTSIMWETDRGCVIVAAQAVSDMTETLLREFFKTASPITDKELDFWFDGDKAPLLSGALKIRLAFALGLIDRGLCESLRKLQRLRSSVAAHSRSPFRLTLDHAKEICENLPEDFRASFLATESPARTLVTLVSQEFTPAAEPVSPAKLAFHDAVQMLLALLHARHRQSGGSAK